MEYIIHMETCATPRLSLEFNDCLNKFYEENPLIEICFNEQIYPCYSRIGNKYVFVQKILKPYKTYIIKLVVYKGTFISNNILQDNFCSLYDEEKSFNVSIVLSQNIYETYKIYNYIEHFAFK